MSQPASEFGATGRREFLKSSSLAAVGTGLLGSLSSLSGAHAAGDDTIKVGLIGCGGRGTGAAGQAISTAGNVKLVAMADAFADRIQDCISTWKRTPELQEKLDRIDVPPERQFVGFDAYKKVIASGVDLVILTTPPGFRPIHFEAAINAGKHVFMEKPVAVDAPGVRRVLAAVEESKKKKLAVGVGLQRHHDPRYIETIQRLKDGAIGEIHTARVYWNDQGVWVHQRKPEETEMEYQMRNWYYFNWLCGDHIVEQHIHNMDVINWLKGTHPVRAQGQGGRQVRVGKEYGEIFDHHYVEFEYADGSRMFSQCRHIPQCWSSVSEHVQGASGLAAISDGYIKSTGAEWRYKGRSVNPYQVEHDDLFASIRSGNPLNEGEYGAISTMTAIYGRMCTYSGKVLTWEDAFNSKISLQPKEFDFHADPPVMPNADGVYAVAVPGQTNVV
jgi:predicted dehydrogenase